jgi:hypothetical protein
MPRFIQSVFVVFLLLGFLTGAATFATPPGQAASG